MCRTCRTAIKQLKLAYSGNGVNVGNGGSKSYRCYTPISKTYHLSAKFTKDLFQALIAIIFRGVIGNKGLRKLRKLRNLRKSKFGVKVKIQITRINSNYTNLSRFTGALSYPVLQNNANECKIHQRLVPDFNLTYL